MVRNSALARVDVCWYFPIDLKWEFKIGKKGMTVSKKPDIDVGSKLKDAVRTIKPDKPKANVTLKIDAKVLADAKAVFEGRLGTIFEAALEDALRIYKEDKKNR